MCFRTSKFALAGLMLVSLQHQAWSKDAPAELAAGLLAKSKAMDIKCNFLNGTDRNDLATLVARAEVALAGRESIDDTKAVMSKNAALGNGATCSADERSEVTNVLSAARMAASKIAVMAPVAAKPEMIMPKVETAVASPLFSFAPNKPNMKITSGLSAYASLTERYYLARRCGTMTSRNINSFYQTVVSTHKQVLSAFGRNAVASVMMNSESVANNKSCS